MIKKINLLIIISVFVKLVLGVLYHYFKVSVPFDITYPDSGNDENYFIDLYFAGSPLESGNISYLLYPWLASIIFLGIKSKFLFFAFNISLSIITLNFTYKILKHFNSIKIALIGTLILAILPMRNVYSFLFLREELITSMFLVSVFYVVIAPTNVFRFLCGLSAFSIVVISHPSFAVLIPIWFVYLLRRKIGTFRALILGSFTILIVYFLLQGRLTDYLYEMNLETISSYAEERLDRKIDIIDDRFLLLDYNSTSFDLISGFILRPFVSEYAAGPLRIPNSLLVYSSLVFIVFFFNRLKELRLFLLFNVFIMFIVFAFGSIDINQSDRHRSKMIPLLISVLPYSRQKEIN